MIAFLNDPIVREALRTAWLESNPGVAGGHEEGGFILRDVAHRLSVARWPLGKMDRIELPPHLGGTFGGLDIVASFHTHPNLGPDYQQEPSETDKRAVRHDPDLKGLSYLGEFVISNERIYWIGPDGDVAEIAETARLFENEERAEP